MKTYPPVRERLPFDPKQRLREWIEKQAFHSQLDRTYAEFWLEQALMLAYEAGQLNERGRAA